MTEGLRILAAIVIGWRIRKRLFTRAESVVLLVWAVHFVLETLQVAIADKRILNMDERYVRPVDVLLVGWVAWGGIQLCARWAKMKLVLMLCVAMLFSYSVVMVFKHHANGRRARVVRLAEVASEVIRADWKGRSLDEKMVFSAHDYHSRRRPVVQCKYGCVAWLSGGRRANIRIFKGVDRPDYMVVPMSDEINGVLLKTIEVGRGSKAEQWGVYKPCKMKKVAR